MKNTTTLIGCYGNDKTHALAAWTSTFLELDIPMPKQIEDRVPALVNHILLNSKRMRDIPSLLKFLGDEKHNSPFRFSVLHFSMTTEIATHIHFLKHQVALRADNGESARYKELKEDKAYYPKDWIENENQEVKMVLTALKLHTEKGNKLYHEAIKVLTPHLGKQRAKETARFFKGYNSQINTQKMFSFGSFAEVYHKRNLETPSQREIAWIIEDMRNQVQETGLFNESLKALKMWKPTI